MFSKRIEELKNRLVKLTAIMDSNDYDPIKLEEQLNELDGEFSKLEKEIEKEIDKEDL